MNDIDRRNNVIAKILFVVAAAGIIAAVYMLENPTSPYDCDTLLLLGQHGALNRIEKQVIRQCILDGGVDTDTDGEM